MAKVDEFRSVGGGISAGDRVYLLGRHRTGRCLSFRSVTVGAIEVEVEIDSVDPKKRSTEWIGATNLAPLPDDPVLRVGAFVRDIDNGATCVVDAVTYVCGKWHVYITTRGGNQYSKFRESFVAVAKPVDGFVFTLGMPVRHVKTNTLGEVVQMDSAPGSLFLTIQNGIGERMKRTHEEFEPIETPTPHGDASTIVRELRQQLMDEQRAHAKTRNELRAARSAVQTLDTSYATQTRLLAESRTALASANDAHLKALGELGRLDARNRAITSELEVMHRNRDDAMKRHDAAEAYAKAVWARFDYLHRIVKAQIDAIGHLPSEGVEIVHRWRAIRDAVKKTGPSVSFHEEDNPTRKPADVDVAPQKVESAQSVSIDPATLKAIQARFEESKKSLEQACARFVEEVSKSIRRGNL